MHLVHTRPLSAAEFSIKDRNYRLFLLTHELRRQEHQRRTVAGEPLIEFEAATEAARRLALRQLS